MFGYLTACVEALSEAEQARYKACYCGLCRSLGERRGQLSRLTLNFDMTFLIILLESLYEPEINHCVRACPVHPLKPSGSDRSIYTDYAADMNVALTYLKCLDNWNDDANPDALAVSGILRNKYKNISCLYPRQIKTIEGALDSLSQIEKSGKNVPDEAAAVFGSLMAEIFVYKEDRWSEYLRAAGDALGRFIYLCDAICDLDDDVKWARYNPLSDYYGKENNGIYFSSVLKMYLSDCLKAIDYLPLVADTGIINNILCFGLWTEFNKKFNEMKGQPDVSGSL